jgi:integrase
LPFTFHCIRHTYATLALANGVSPDTVAHNLGQNNREMVLRVYGHVIPAVAKEDTRRGVAQFGLAPPTNVRAIR